PLAGQPVPSVLAVLEELGADAVPLEADAESAGPLRDHEHDVRPLAARRGADLRRLDRALDLLAVDEPVARTKVVARGLLGGRRERRTSPATARGPTEATETQSSPSTHRESLPLCGSVCSVSLRRRVRFRIWKRSARGVNAPTRSPPPLRRGGRPRPRSCSR